MKVRALLSVAVLAGLATACGDPNCGHELRYDRAVDLCVCPNGGRYLPGDGGYVCVLPDGSVTPFGDAGPMAPEDAGVPVDAPAAEEDAGCETRTLHRDADGDGFGDAEQTMESCEAVEGWVEDATDCDDACETCFPGASETCNGLDDDCDLVEDEGLVTSTYYVDCDGDGYAPVGASFVVACAEPDEGPEGCTEGGWTTRAPTTGATDCADGDANAFPGQTEWFETAIAGAPAAVDFDYDCDGEETQRESSVFVCPPGGFPPASPSCPETGRGWQSFSVLGCGVAGTLTIGECDCINRYEDATQACR